MTASTPDNKAVNGTLGFTDKIGPERFYGEFEILVTRHDGKVERRTLRNIVTAAGLNRIANRAVTATGTTPFYVLGVGTITAAASLDSTNFGEVTNGRKAASTVVQSREWFALTMTWAGNADSLTGILLDSAAMLCHASSGQGAVANIVNAMSVTLGASDFLLLTARIRVGSHDLSHTT
jgi:hypothetical protein